jgi:uncharacterized RDD family membrane protein YckC
MTATTPGRKTPTGHDLGLPAEARSVQGRRAGAVTRTVATGVDSVVAVLVVAIGYGIWAALRFLRAPQQFTPPAPPWGALLLAFLGALFVYFAVSWATTGRTYGGHLLGLRVVGPSGSRVGLPLSIVRAATCVVLPIGLYWVLFSSANRSAQDVLLRTSVVYDWTNTPRQRVPR